ncbi:MAG: hypothetical protein LAP40_17400 [Acidobacteriia bacterium]|nr:hypothetical protein [Terriglobia bacterium]
MPVPDGSGEAEVRVSLRLAASGGSYTEFLQASQDARSSGPGSGTYLAFEMQNPEFDAHGHCNADFVVLQSVHGAATLLASFQHACRDGKRDVAGSVVPRVAGAGAQAGEGETPA